MCKMYKENEGGRQMTEPQPLKDKETGKREMDYDDDAFLKKDVASAVECVNCDVACFNNNKACYSRIMVCSCNNIRTGQLFHFNKLDQFV